MMTEESDVFRGERVYLTALQDDDASSIAGWFDSSRFCRRYDAVPARPRTPDEMLEAIKRARQSDTQFLFGFRQHGDHRLVGWGGFDEVIWNHRVAWLTVALDPEEWGRGLGTDAVTLLLRYAFDELSMHRVQLTTFAYNSVALNLYMRLGFQREGVFREFVQRDGHRHDMFLLGLLVPEWREKQQEARQKSDGR